MTAPPAPPAPPATCAYCGATGRPLHTIDTMWNGETTYTPRPVCRTAWLCTKHRARGHRQPDTSEQPA